MNNIKLYNYFTEVCPSCEEISPYIPNPIYMHNNLINDIELEKDIFRIRQEVKEDGRKLFSEIKNEN